jgi:putrescine transport system ATP-binding protein
LLDEPLGALDKKLRETTQLELVNIIEKVGVTCVMVTHDQEEAMTMSSRIAVMSEGRFLQVGSPREIYETPQTEFVADFIGNVNLFEGEITIDTTELAEVQTADALHIIDHAIPGQVGGKTTIAIRPEKMELSRTAPEQRGNQAHGVIKEIAYYGSDTLFHIKLDGTGKMIKGQAANTERYADDKLTWDDAVYVSWTSDAIVPVAPSYS